MATDGGNGIPTPIGETQALPIGTSGSSGMEGQRTDGRGVPSDRRRTNRRMDSPSGRAHPHNRGSGVDASTGGLPGAALRVLSSPALHDQAAEKRWPELVKTLNAVKDINGDACDPGGFSVTVKAGRLSWSLRSPAYNVRVSGWADTLEGVLDAMEGTLRSPDPVVTELKKHVTAKYRQKKNPS